MAEETDRYHVRQPGALGDLGSLMLEKSKLPIPKIRVDSTYDIQTIMTRLYRKIIMRTEDDAKEFAQEAAKNMKWHIDQFSKRTEGSGRPGLGSGAITGERLRPGGLRGGVGWEVEEGELGWEGIAGIGIGRGKVPLSPSGEGKPDHPYAHFVDRGTGPSKGKYIPKYVDIELSDMRDPTRRLKWHKIPKQWTPKFTPGSNEMQDQWWQSAKKRAQEKKGIRKAIGRYFQEPSTILFTKPFEGRRKAYAPHIPEYDVTAMGMAYGKRKGKPFLGQEIWFGRKRVRRTEPHPTSYNGPWRTIESYKREQTEALAGLQGMTEHELDQFRMKQLAALPYEFYVSYENLYGGDIHGYGGGKIMLGTGDIAFNMFSLDIRMGTQLLGMDNLAMLEGLPDNIGTEVSNERGLGLRLNNSTGKLRGGEGALGWHRGTVPRNFVFNTAQHMRRWLENKYQKQKDLRSIASS